jgi:hypothetical protein
MQLNCGVRAIRYPKEYFSMYKEIIRQKKINTNLRINGAYISSFESNSNTYTSYTFLYQIFLTTSITIPITINNITIETEQELLNTIKDGRLDYYFNYGYYKIDGNTIDLFSLDKWIGGIVYFGYTYPIIQSSATIVNDSTILTSDNIYRIKKATGIRFKSKLSNISSENETLKFKPLTIKPDSSKSDFLLNYKSYLNSKN